MKKITIKYLQSQGLAWNFPQRFWRLVDVRGPDECWPFLGRKVGKSKHGMLKTGLRVNGKQTEIMAHRAAYALCKGKIPKGKIVRHNCVKKGKDTPNCCNPKHLQLGTHKQNTHDAWRKGTWKPTEALPGEKNHRAKLTNKQVEEIRRRYATEAISMKKLGAQYGVGAVAVHRYIHGRRYGSNPFSS